MENLRSARISLKRLSESDVDERYLDTLNDKLYMQYSRQSQKFHTLKSQILYINAFNHTQNELFGIRNNHDNTLVGSLSYYVDYSSFSINLGFLIFRDHAGKGYATDALEVLLPFLESHFPGMEVVIGTNKGNIPMQKIALGVGFVLKSKLLHDDRATLHFVKKLPQVTLSSTPFIPSFVLSAKKIGVVANDAGGAEQISWLLRQLPQQILAKLEGPAKILFEKSQLQYSFVEDLEQLIECDVLITGSGWMTKLELTAIEFAKKQGIPCLTMLDHWVNYRERFQRAGLIKVWPQHIGVTNSLALQKAQVLFPDNPIWLFPDFQIKHYQKILGNVAIQRNSILVVLEPPPKHHLNSSLADETIVQLIEKSIEMKHSKGIDSLILRLHPSQTDTSHLGFYPDKYSDQIEFSSNYSLLEDLKRSSTVVGISSYALYLAAMCEIETFSVCDDSEGHWTSHFASIKKL